MAKRTAEQVLDALSELDDEEIEREIERIEASSVAEREAALRAMGVDVEAEKAKAAAQWEAMHGEGTTVEAAAATVAPVVGLADRRSRGRTATYVLIAAVVAIGAAAGVIFAIPRTPSVPIVGVATPPAVEAASLRRRAFAACDRSAWTACLADLDRARALDPGGESDPRVRASRASATAALAAPSSPER